MGPLTPRDGLTPCTSCTRKKSPYGNQAGVCVPGGALVSLMLRRELRPGELAQHLRVTTPRLFSTGPRTGRGLVSGVWVFH